MSEPGSETPRTDAKYEETINGDCLPGCDSHAHEEMCPYCNPDAVMAGFARQLERELSAVNAERVSLWQVAQHDRMITEEAHRLSRELSAERARRERCEEGLAKLADSECAKIMALSDEQIKALSAFNGHHPDDEAALAKKTMEIALLRFRLERCEEALARLERAMCANDCDNEFYASELNALRAALKEKTE